MIWTILIVILVLILLGGVGGPYVRPGWQPGYGAGWYGNGAIVVILLILILFFLFGREGRFGP